MATTVTVRGSKHWPAREGVGWCADFYVGALKVASVRDDGNGGPLHWEPARSDEGRAAFVALAAEHGVALKERVTTVGAFIDVPYDSPLDGWAATVVDGYENDKRLRRHCKTKTLFRLKGDEEGSYRTVTAPFSPAVKAWLVKKYGELVEDIVNERL